MSVWRRVPSMYLGSLVSSWKVSFLAMLNCSKYELVSSRVLYCLTFNVPGFGSRSTITQALKNNEIESQNEGTNDFNLANKWHPSDKSVWMSGFSLRGNKIRTKFLFVCIRMYHVWVFYSVEVTIIAIQTCKKTQTFCGRSGKYLKIMLPGKAQIIPLQRAHTSKINVSSFSLSIPPFLLALRGNSGCRRSREHGIEVARSGLELHSGKRSHRFS